MNVDPTVKPVESWSPQSDIEEKPMVQTLVNVPNELGEGPIWHPDERRLYWTDIVAGKMYRLDPATGDHECVYEGRPVGGLTVQADGSLLLFRDGGNVVVWRDGEEVKTIVEALPGEAESRFNDAIADPLGNVISGTMPTDQQKGRLYRLRVDGRVETVVESVDICNGMGFNAYLNTFYFIETRAQCVFAFDFNLESGDLTNQRRLIEVPEAMGHPDGMTVDADDHLWVAMWGTGQVVRFAPDGSEEQTIRFPAHNTTAPAFAPRPGGEGRAPDALYVTSAGSWCDLEAPDNQQAGALFCVTGVGSGRPEFRSRVGL